MLGRIQAEAINPQVEQLFEMRLMNALDVGIALIKISQTSENLPQSLFLR